MTTPVVLVSGPYAGARAAVVRRLLADHPGSVAMHHERDLWPLPGAALLVVELEDTAEPRPFAEAVAARAGLRLAAALTALDARHMPVDILRGDRLPGRDERYVAEVLARQVEYATHLVLDGGDAEDGELARAVLAHLAPATPVHHVRDGLPPLAGRTVCTEELADRVDPATALLPCEARTGAVTTVVWHRLRPLHPGRLFQVTEELAACTVRGRGRFWLACRHDRLLAWDSVAGRLTVHDAGPWLAARPPSAWDACRPARRAVAALDWNPVTGDRVQHLVFTGPDLDRRHICDLLDGCLLDQTEMLAGSDAWSGYDDPFSLVLDVDTMLPS
ncbi:GTP-binding protein [Nonomuraea rubra]|uniref:G3E family GTPase n=1 Tax=Nonomuraea rubra TaxID=46180 RepID=A0A7X0NUT8_9ACTN|nr:GTP-binding protein [Nonomuraea rubra]MBB6549952.1 G3E family GTPase [Nonomuraea rubra]